MSRIYPLDNLTINSTSLTRLKARRKQWLQVHLWLGLGFGLFLAVIGLTGSVLVFWHELDEALNPALYESTPGHGASRKSLDELIAAAERAAPKGWGSAGVNAAEESGNAVFGFFYLDAGASPEQAQALNIAVNPYTADVVAQRIFYHAWNPLKHSLVGFFLKLHYSLFLGDTGTMLVGILALLFFVSVMSGLILWWPLTGKWRRVLTIKRHASHERFNHDLHQSAGFYSLLVLLPLLVSGVYFNLPDQFRWLVERFSVLTPAPRPTPAPLSPVSATVLEHALQQTLRKYPGGAAQFYAFTPDNTGPFTACFRNVPDLRAFIVDSRCFKFNRANGELLAISDPAHGSAGDVFMQWQWPLHSGQAFGWTGRILVCIAGLMCPLLFLTGVLRWLQKRRARRYRSHVAG